MIKVLIAASLLILAGCNSTSWLANEQPTIAGLCATAMTLSPFAGPYAVYIAGACGTEAAVAKLALDPSSVEWLQGILAKVHAL